ncbi:MAG TPA: dihydrolipoamide acetyltransferase family protein [Acidimicrobiales bacterium]|nr:dihydrolipoamide acetyltransferase family protein [Acidimicrobiales bacterium]
MGEFRMPSLGADMESGTIVEWRVAPGDEVARGDIIAVVDTEKSTIEVEVFESGVVEALLVGEGEEVPVGTPLARIAPAGAAATATTALVGSPLVRRLAETAHVDLAALRGTGPGGLITRHDVEAVTQPSPPAPAPPVRVAPPPPVRVPPDGARPRISPRARRLANEAGIDIDALAAAAGDRPVTGADIEHTAPAPKKVDKGASMRHAIAQVMARSKREIPHYYLSHAVDLSRAMEWLDATNAARTVADRILPAALLLKATATAASKVGEINGVWRDDAFVPSDRVHLGVAISLRGGGLLAPCIHDAGTLTLEELMAALRDLVERARAGRLRGSEMSDGTLTVTNLGDQGVDEVFPVIYAPQVAIVGFGRVTERPWAEAGMIGARPVVTATLAADHRVSDGLRGARFLDVLARSLQDPGAL